MTESLRSFDEEIQPEASRDDHDYDDSDSDWHLPARTFSKHTREQNNLKLSGRAAQRSATALAKAAASKAAATLEAKS
jgi:hypothetical protein